MKNCIAICLLALVVIGCAGCPSELTPQTQTAINNNRQQTAIKVDGIKQQGKVDDAQAAANPLRHPFKATNQTVKAARRPLGFIVLASLVVLGASIGIAFTPLSFVSKFAVPISGGIFVLSFAGLIVLPFSPLIVCGVIAAALALGIYELVRWRKKLLDELKLAASGITLLQPQPRTP